MTGIGDHWRSLDAARIPAFLKSVDHYGPCFELAGIAAASGVNHTIIYRISTQGQGNGIEYDVPDYSLTPVAAAQKHWTNTRAKLPPEFDKQRVWSEPINEVDKNRADWLGQFAVELAKLANGQGYKVTLFGWASGEPEPSHWQTPGVLAYLRYCAANPDKAAVSVHEYSYNVNNIKDGYPNKIGRFTQLLGVCQQNNIAPPQIHITEWGWEYETVPAPDPALADITWAHSVYSPYPAVKGTAIWYLGPGFGNIADKAQKLIAPVTQFDLSHPPVEPPPPPSPCVGEPRVQYRRSYVLLPPNADQVWAEQAVKGSWNSKRLTIGASADDAGIGALNVRNILAVNPESWSGDLEAFYEEYYPGINYIPLAAANPFQLRQLLQFYNPQTGEKPVLPVFKATHWPTDYKTINQVYGANPCNYCEYGLASHEGVDIKAPAGSNVYAIASGTVYLAVTAPGPMENYGKQVRVRHSNGFWSVYAHLESVGVAVGQVVQGGQRLGAADNTGNSFGSHLHLGLGHDDERMWVDNARYIDPMPYLEHLLNVPGYTYGGRPVTFAPSLHAPGSDGEWQNAQVQDLYKKLAIPVKWLSNGISANYYPSLNRPEFHLIRCFWKPDRKKTPAQAWTEDIRDGVMAFWNKGGRRFELLNEPNITSEGWGMVWANASELGEWLWGMTNIIKSNCPGAMVYFPGMSPGVPWTNQFGITNVAWPICRPVMDGFCLHAYTGNVTDTNAAAAEIVTQVVEAQKYLNLQVPLILSEASVNRAAAPQFKASVYRAIETSLRSVAGIEAVSWFISSWAQAPAGEDANQESWLKYGIGTAYLNTR